MLIKPVLPRAAALKRNKQPLAGNFDAFAKFFISRNNSEEHPVSKGSLRTEGKKGMTRATACLALLLALGSIAGANAQGIHDNNDNGKADKGTSGSGVKTGRGPLSYPIPPAVSTTNPNQNYQRGPERPQNMPGPALTNPPQQPFGSR
jgi:hypothetical protein